MPVINLEGIGMRGLNTDQDAQLLGVEYFQDGLDIRPKDGSLESVKAFDNRLEDFFGYPSALGTNYVSFPVMTKFLSGENKYFLIQGVNDPDLARTGDLRFDSGLFLSSSAVDVSSLIPSAVFNLATGTIPNVARMAIWKLTGSTATNLVMLYEDQDLNPALGIIKDIEKKDFTDADYYYMPLTNLSLDLSTERVKLDVFQFNELLVINDSINQPFYLKATQASDGSIQSVYQEFIPGWFTRGIDNTLAPANDGTTLDTPDTTTIPGTTLTTVLDYNEHVQRTEDNRITINKMLSYNGRFIALNISKNYLNSPDNINSNTLGNSTLAWSTPISSLGDIDDIEFRASSTNSAGDDILTDTPGAILDAGLLGPYLIVYKEDAVYRYQDVGDPLYLQGEPIITEDGLFSEGSFIDLGDGRHFVLGRYGIYLHDGSPNRKEIAKGRILRGIYDDVNPSFKYRTFLHHNKTEKEIWVCYPSIANNFKGCDRAFVYNYADDFWYKRSLFLIRGMVSAALNSEEKAYIYGVAGISELSVDNNQSNGYLRWFKKDLGDRTVNKRVTAVYPNVTGKFKFTLVPNNYITYTGTGVNPDLVMAKDFVTRDPQYIREYDASTSDTFKLDYRLTGRYYSMEIAANDVDDMNFVGLSVNVEPSTMR